ncbi:MAG: FAD binding domain-containing protein [Candidatus Acidiferrales bacterium]
MFPTSFEYHRPSTLAEAAALLQADAEARVLAGGHSLLPAMKLRLAAPAALIDLRKIRELAYIRDDRDTISLGALTTHTEIAKSKVLRQRAPLLAEAAAQIGDMQVRNCGTLGGAAAHADPGADYPAALLALEAELVLAGRSGTRKVAAKDFFVEMMTTALRPLEILTEVRFAADGAHSGSAYLKLAQPASGFALVGVAVRLEMAGSTKCRQARVGITGVAPKAYRPAGVERALTGKTLSAELIAQAARKAAGGIEPLSDLFASARYRAAMAEVFTRRAVTLALERAPRKR